MSTTIPLVDLDAQYKSIQYEINSAIKEVLKTKKFIQGPYSRLFADEFAQIHRIPYAVGCSNGTSAISILLRAAGITVGDEVITTPHTFFATVEAICAVGAKPVFIDIEPKTYNIDPRKIEGAITKKTRAIIPVHLYGNPCEMDLIKKIASKHGLTIIEDCAQAHLAKYDNKSVGTFGLGGTLSFYPGKNLGAYGDAGAIISNSKKIIDRCELLLNHGRHDKYLHIMIGENARMDGIQAQILRAKLPHIMDWTEKRRQNAKIYSQLLEQIPDIVTPFALPKATHVYHLFVIRIPKRDRVKAHLKSRGIQTGIHYPTPLHLQPALNYLDYDHGDFPECEKAAEQILSLPLYPELTEGQIMQVVNEIKKIL